jgi:sarcosine oxidase, subunit alpha
MAPDADRRFRFGRAERSARPGETVLGALARGRWPSLARSVRYHRPRGPFCGVGTCTGCLVRINGIPNQRACRTIVRDGDRVETENAWPSPRWDLFGALDLMFPHGLDSVHGLRRPAWAIPLYQRVTRRLAGFGRPPTPASAAPAPPPTVRTAEVAIVGAGRSGRELAAALRGHGVRPLVLDRRPADVVRGEGERAPEGDLLGSVTVAILPSPASREGDGPRTGHQLLGFDDRGGGILVRARAVVLATGSYDAGLLFEGSDRPGVVTADLAVSDLELPWGETVVFGGGERARQVVEHRAGDVVAVVAPGEIAPDLARAAAERGVPLYPRSRLVRSVGRGHVRAVELARRDGGGRFRLGCRSVVLAHRRLPNAQLVFQAGGARRWADGPGAYFPTIDPVGRSDVAGVFAVGSVARPREEPASTADQVAAAILGGPTPAPGPAPAPVPGRPRAGEMVPYYRELLREPRRGKWVLCPCEDVLVDELEHAVARGYAGLELGMRYTGVGTGLCQGRYCLPEAIAILAGLGGVPPPEVGVVTQRPPLVPMPLGALAALEDAVAEADGP